MGRAGESHTGRPCCGKLGIPQPTLPGPLRAQRLGDQLLEGHGAALALGRFGCCRAKRPAGGPHRFPDPGLPPLGVNEAGSLGERRSRAAQAQGRRRLRLGHTQRARCSSAGSQHHLVAQVASQPQGFVQTQARILLLRQPELRQAER